MAVWKDKHNCKPYAKKGLIKIKKHGLVIIQGFPQFNFCMIDISRGSCIQPGKCGTRGHISQMYNLTHCL